jgi:hypothetical protein
MVDLGPEYERVQGMLLQALVQTGAADEAVAAYREAQAAGVEDTVGYLAVDLAWGFYRTGEHEKALPIIEEWLAAHPEPTGHEQYHFMWAPWRTSFAAWGEPRRRSKPSRAQSRSLGRRGPPITARG